MCLILGLLDAVRLTSNLCEVYYCMPNFLVQVTQYGFANIEADDIDDAKDKAEKMPAKEFDMSKDVDVDVLSECDENGAAI